MTENFQVLKFGGTSMGSKQSLNQVLEILKDKIKSKKIYVVVSAMSGVTDKLIELGLSAKNNQLKHQILREIENLHQKTLVEFGLTLESSPLELLFQELEDALTKEIFINEIPQETYLDFIKSFGERLSASLLTSILKINSVKAEFVDARELIVTDENFGNASVDYEVSTERTKNYFQNLESQIPNLQVLVITGFIGRSSKGATTTLGRGGSDFTGGLLANFLDSRMVEIWTDVDGVLSTDPRISSEAKIINQLSFSEAFEVAYYGGKVLYPKTMEACLPKNISIVIKNTFNPQAKGTVVTTESLPGLKVVSRNKNITIVEIIFGSITSEIGLLGRIFSWFSLERITINVVTTSGDSVSFSCDKNPSKDLIEKIETEIGQIRILENQEIVALIGTNILNQENYLKIMNFMVGFKPKMISMNTKNTNLTVVVESGQGEELISRIHPLIIQ